jgi:hypothetical protein
LAANVLLYWFNSLNDISFFTILFIVIISLLYSKYSLSNELKNKKFNTDMQWSIIVSGQLVKNKSWHIIYTNINGQKFSYRQDYYCKLGFWSEPIINENCTNAVVCNNSVYFLINTIPVFHNDVLNPDTEYFTVFLVEYDLALSKEINRIQIINKRIENFFDFDGREIVYFRLAHVLINSGQSTVCVWLEMELWMLDLNSKKMISLTFGILEYVKKTLLDNINPIFIYTVWQGYLIVDCINGVTTPKMTAILVFFNNFTLPMIVENVKSMQIINKNLALFQTYDNSAWSVTSMQQFLSKNPCLLEKLTLKPSKPERQCLLESKLENKQQFDSQQFSSFNYYGTNWDFLTLQSNYYDWHDLLKIWKNKNLLSHASKHSGAYYINFQNNKNDNTASILAQYTKPQRLLRMNQIISETGLFLPKDVLFFITEF